MRFEILLAPEAIEDLRKLKAGERTAVKEALETHLRHEPTKTSRSRIKRLRGVARPQYRLRVEEVRVFYDVSGSTVEVLADRAQTGGRVMAGAVRKSKVKEVPLSEVKDDLSRFLREAETQDVVITRHGKPAGVLIGFKSEDDWFDYRLEHDPRFIQRVEQARASFRVGRGVKLEDIK